MGASPVVAVVKLAVLGLDAHGHVVVLDHAVGVEDVDEEFVEVHLKGVRFERLRDFGEVWLALGLWRLLGLDTLLAEKMPGFHWMTCYGDYMKEIGYACKKLGIQWEDLTA
mgnify:CR=1 FL=1